MRLEPLLCLALLACASTAALAVKPTRDELATARRWARQHPARAPRSTAPAAQAAAPPPAGLVVLANHDRLVLNVRPDGVPIKIGKETYRRGLLAHAPSRVLVRLPGPGKAFTSLVGIHADAGGGSVVYSVRAGGQEAFRSGVVHCGDAPLPVSVDLAGATEFLLEVGDAGDGISCDQADWADARAVLADGSEVWLGDLAIVTPATHGRTAAVPPFSFVCDGKCSDEFLGSWKYAENVSRLDAQRTRRVQTYTDPATGLEVRCEAVQYQDFPTIEWTLHFRNSGSRDTPILSEIQALDIRLTRPDSGEFVLHHHRGTPCTPRDYEPFETPLRPGTVKRIGATGGRPMNTDMPYFNLEWGGGGVIAVLGWPGQWASQFTAERDGSLRVYAGQETTHFRLHPGEEVRSPLVVLQFWRGDRVRSQNIWRRWMIAHNLPRPGGKPIPVTWSGTSGCYTQADSTMSEETEKGFVDGHVAHDFVPDYWWMDAGWYTLDPSQGWPNTGTWEADPKRFPGGLRAVADHAHARGMKVTVWFEPERVTPGTWLAENHPEWVIGGKAGGLLDLGNAGAWRWLVDHIDRMITENRLGMYRQDFNMDPLAYWQSRDAEDRQGITEIRHVEGYLAFWDELSRRHPGMPIDCCASGGRRNDLESMRRGIPLSKTDYCGGTTSSQCQLHGIASWLPYFGAGYGVSTDPYVLRSNFAPWSAGGWDTRKSDVDYETLRRLLAEWRRVAPCFLGDYYPLTPYSLDENVWMAWQFDAPEKGEGIVQAFRRPGSPDDSARYRLHGLDAGALYEVTRLDEGSSRRLAGRELMDPGLAITVGEKPGAAVIVYRKVGRGDR